MLRFYRDRTRFMWTLHKARAKTMIYTNIHNLIEFVYYMLSGAHKLAARGAGTKMWGAQTWGARTLGRSNRLSFRRSTAKAND